MDQWNSRDDAQERSFFGKTGMVSLVIGFVLYFFFG